jgi:hypothetical protein
MLELNIISLGSTYTFKGMGPEQAIQNLKRGSFMNNAAHV